MKVNTNNLVWYLLIALTILAAVIAGFDSTYVMLFVLVISVLKFSAVAFYFMNLRKAHPFWKISVLGFLCLFTVILLIL